MGRVDTNYESDHTRFMREMMEKNPEWTEDQRKGRAIWWDKKQETDTTRRNNEANEDQKPYPYDVNF